MMYESLVLCARAVRSRLAHPSPRQHLHISSGLGGTCLAVKHQLRVNTGFEAFESGGLNFASRRWIHWNAQARCSAALLARATPLLGFSMQSSFDRLITEGLSASRANQTQAALACFTQASQEQPQSGLPHFLIGTEYAQAGLVQEAELAFANAVLLSPNMSIARYQLGLLQFSSDRLAMALVTWQPLLALPEDDPLRQFVLGFSALGQEALDAAIVCFQKGMALNQSNPPMNRDIELVLAQIARLRGEAPPLAPSSRAAGAPAESEDQMHVLLANYQPGGNPH
ncbi:MAG TPA: hypothetical protein VGM81_16500 [Burkholderiaceae bacterium]